MQVAQKQDGQIKLFSKKSTFPADCLPHLITELNHYLAASGRPQRVGHSQDPQQAIGEFVQFLQTGSSSAALVQDEVGFLRRREVASARRQKQARAEVMDLMKALAGREQQIHDKDNEIFGLQLALQQKEKALLRLQLQQTQDTTRPDSLPLTESYPRAKVKPVPQKNSPAPILEQQSRVSEAVQGPGQPCAGWRQQRAGLLLLLKQKERKIYELIRELHLVQK